MDTACPHVQSTRTGLPPRLPAQPSPTASLPRPAHPAAPAATSPPSSPASSGACSTRSPCTSCSGGTRCSGGERACAGHGTTLAHAALIPVVMHTRKSLKQLPFSLPMPLSSTPPLSCPCAQLRRGVPRPGAGEPHPPRRHPAPRVQANQVRHMGGRQEWGVEIKGAERVRGGTI